MNNPHKQLGLEQGSSRVEIDAAFRRLAKSFHPDVNPEDPDAAERFRQLRVAYEVLKCRLDEGSASQPDASSTGEYNPPYEDSFGLRPRSRRQAIKRAMMQGVIVLLATFGTFLILLYIIWANTQTDWIPGCCY